MKAAYIAAVGSAWISPADFWRLRPEEFWWLYEAKTPVDQLPKTEMWDELYDLLDE